MSIRASVLAVVLAMLLPPELALAQDAGELRAERVKAGDPSAPHPLAELMSLRNSRLLPALRGMHPRVYFTDSELTVLRGRAHGTQAALWKRALLHVRALEVPPAPAPAQARRAQNETGLGIAEAAFAYRMEGDPKYLDAAKKYMDAAVSYEVWGYANNKPDVDLAAGHLLYGLAWGYDLLYADLSEAERARYRGKLVAQARKMYAYFEPQPGKTYAYSQNHVFIPVAGLGIAAYALYDEADEAPQWAALARAIFDRVLETYSTDGYYYEGFEYWVFSTPWLVHWLDAHAHATGEDLYDRPGLRGMATYVAHATLPDRDNVFDFGDVWAGPDSRAKKGDDYARSHPDGHFSTNYNLLYRIASRFADRDAQGIAQWLEAGGQLNAEEFWSLPWFDERLAATPIGKQQRWHYFPDHEVVYWRSGWDADATAFAFKCGPPEGHHAAALLERFKDWRLSAGHAHPDAGSFIVYARGAYLTGDSGYAGVPLTEHHNSVLVGRRGQGREGAGHDPWDDVPYAQLDLTKIRDVKLGAGGVSLRADATGAYLPELGLKKFERRFEYTPAAGFTITDTLESATPQVFTALIHADDRFTTDDAGRYAVRVGDAALRINVVKPVDARIGVEGNELIGPGPPGAVDKGERMKRGERLAITTQSTAATQIVVKLAVGTWPRSK